MGGFKGGVLKILDDRVLGSGVSKSLGGSILG